MNLGNLKGMFGKKSVVESPLELTQYGFGGAFAEKYLYRMVAETLNRCSNKDRFTQLYSTSLVFHMVNLIRTGRLEGYLYIDNKNDAFAFYTEKSKEKITAIKEIKIKIEREDTSYYTFIQAIAVSLNTLLEGSADNIQLSKLKVFKMEGARNHIPDDYTEKVKEKINKVFKKAKGEELLLIDSKDEFFQFETKSEKVDTISMDKLLKFAVNFTGFPLSFFTGEFTSGLGSTDKNEERMYHQACSYLFDSVLKPFFEQIDKKISVVVDINQALLNARPIIDLAQFDDRVDIMAVYKMLGIPTIDGVKDESNVPVEKSK